MLSFLCFVRMFFFFCYSSCTESKLNERRANELYSDKWSRHYDNHEHILTSDLSTCMSDHFLSILTLQFVWMSTQKERAMFTTEYRSKMSKRLKTIRTLHRLSIGTSITDQREKSTFASKLMILDFSFFLNQPSKEDSCSLFLFRRL